MLEILNFDTTQNSAGDTVSGARSFRNKSFSSSFQTAFSMHPISLHVEKPTTITLSLISVLVIVQ